MPLLRHIAGIQTATDQRCIRCCEVIKTKRGSSTGESMPFRAGICVFMWTGENAGPAEQAFYGDGPQYDRWDAEDCKPVDLSPREGDAYQPGPSGESSLPPSGGSGVSEVEARVAELWKKILMSTPEEAGFEQWKKENK